MKIRHYWGRVRMVQASGGDMKCRLRVCMDQEEIRWRMDDVKKKKEGTEGTKNVILVTGSQKVQSPFSLFIC